MHAGILVDEQNGCVHFPCVHSKDFLQAGEDVGPSLGPAGGEQFLTMLSTPVPKAMFL